MKSCTFWPTLGKIKKFHPEKNFFYFRKWNFSTLLKKLFYFLRKFQETEAPKKFLTFSQKKAVLTF